MAGTAREKFLLPLALVATLAAAPAVAQSAGPDAGRGRDVLQEKCARCHNIAPAGESPMPAAPALRDIYGRFAPADLRAMLLQGMVSRHKEMPQIEMTPEDADAVMAYLYRLAGGR